MSVTSRTCIFWDMESIGRRIARAREQKGINQSELARQLKLTPQSVQKWEAGETVPRGQRMQELSRILGVSVGYLMQGEGDLLSPPGVVIADTLIAHAKPRTVDIPRLDVMGSMGGGIARTDGYIEVIEQMTVSEQWVRSHLSATSPGNLAIITGRGDSMEGTFNDGDLLLVDRGVKEIRVDAIYVLAIDGDLFIKRIQRQPGGKIMMISDNSRYAPIELDPSGLPRFEVVGRVLLTWNERRL